MDTLTHGFAAYAVFTLLRRPRVHRTTAAIGAVAPDLDGLWAWASHAHEQAYPLVHRGFSHTVWGAPLLGIGLLFLLAHQPLARKSRLFANVWFTKGALVPTVLGAWSHLVLDGITITGVPLLWPFLDARFTTDWFFFGIPYILPISLFAWIMIGRAKATDRFVVRAFTVIVVILLVAGGVRAYSYPRNLVGDEDVAPGPVEWQWLVSRTTPDGVETYATVWGVPQDRITFSTYVWEHHASDVTADEALALCMARPEFTPWKWDLWGTAAVERTQVWRVARDDNPDPTIGRFAYDFPAALENGTWFVDFVDSAEQYNRNLPSFMVWRNPSRELVIDDVANCVVKPDGSVTFNRPRGWVGS